MRGNTIRRIALGIFTAAALALAAGLGVAAAAPGVTPSTFSATLNPGDSVVVPKVVSTQAIPPTPDIYLLSDSTGSMGPAIANVQANAGAITALVNTQTTGAMFGAGDYKDFESPQVDPYVFHSGAAIGSAASAINAINAWTAPNGSGVDGPEGQLFALHQLATDPTIGFRPDSTRVVVWFGDAPGHDPVCTGFTGLGSNITTSSVISELTAAHIRVIAISLNTGGYPNGLNEDQLFGGFEFGYDAVCGPPSSVSGEATAITNATGGELFTVTSASDVSNAIIAGLQNLPVTVTPTPTCDSGLTATYDAASKTATSGDDVPFTETLTVDPSNPGGTTLHCSVDFKQNGVSGGPAFVQTVNITVNGADLAVAKTAGAALVTEGHPLAYHLVATNNGPAAATGVTVTDHLPANSTFVSASPGCTASAGVVTCTVGNLAAGDSRSFDIGVVAGSAGSTLTNTAAIAGNQNDPIAGNNSSTVVTTLNHNPICSTVTGGPDLWPPNHKLHLITLTGATDPDGNPITTSVMGVTQDEPLNGLGDGDTSPDALPASGTNQVWLRAERSGTGDGRVYRIAFQVSDGLGGQCTGVARVGVPHDQGGHSSPIDSGGVFVDF